MAMDNAGNQQREDDYSATDGSRQTEQQQARLSELIARQRLHAREGGQRLADESARLAREEEATDGEFLWHDFEANHLENLELPSTAAAYF